MDKKYYVVISIIIIKNKWISQTGGVGGRGGGGDYDKVNIVFLCNMYKQFDASLALFNT